MDYVIIGIDVTAIDLSIDRPLLEVENISIVMEIARESDSSGISRIWYWCAI